MKVTALSGGVGGAKLVRGLAQALPCEEALTVIVNTADDTERFGLHISPDLDSVMYALADLADPERGWGVCDESWNALTMLERYGAETWFQLGDRDLATHILRTHGLRQGRTLSEVTRALCARLGVKACVLPMSDDPVRTQVKVQVRVDAPPRWLDFQVYFVKERCRPPVCGVRFVGIEAARPTEAVLEAVSGARLIVLCPSNPLVSLEPILSLPGLKGAIRAAPAPVVSVSPLIGGRAVKGPTVEMLRGLRIDPSPVAVARRYRDLIAIDGFVLDERDAPLRSQIEALGLRVLVVDTLMDTEAKKRQLARAILDTFLPLSLSLP